MVNYQQGKIYKIVCNITGKVYVGSTCVNFLSQRLANHVSAYRKYVSTHNIQYVSSFSIFENNSYKILLLEMCPCDNKEELLMRERYYIENIACVNLRNPCRTQEDINEWNKNYRNKKREQVRAVNKKSKEKHKEKNKVRDKQWREDNKEKVKQTQDRFNEIRRIKTLYLNQLKYYNI